MVKSITISIFLNLLTLSDGIYEAIHNDEVGFAIFLDLAKAFDTANVTKKIFSLGLNIQSCKAIKPRGKKRIPINLIYF